MKLPDYQTVNLEQNLNPKVLRNIAQKLSFPLTMEDKQDIKILETKFDQEENCAGLAAPQIGIAKQIIVFAAPDDPELKKWREDFTQSMEKTIWINPQYKNMDDEQNEDFEACFSVYNLAGKVKRYKKIEYSAFNIHGEEVRGTAVGFLARIIQHEIDHIQGKLFIDYVPENELLKVDEYRKKRAESLASEGDLNNQ